MEESESIGDEDRPLVFTGEDLIAISVTLATGGTRYFMSFGKSFWRKSLNEICGIVLREAQGFALGGEPVSAQPCYSLQDASHSPYFFEQYAYLVARLAQGDDDRIHDELMDGQHLYYLGKPSTYRKWHRDRDAGSDH